MLAVISSMKNYIKGADAKRSPPGFNTLSRLVKEHGPEFVALRFADVLKAQHRSTPSTRAIELAIRQALVSAEDPK